jgi:uncharacterized protein
MTMAATNVSYQPFFDAVARSELAFPHCGQCGRFHWYPKASCPHCGSDRIRWDRITGTATLFSFTIVRRAFATEFEDGIPYTLALIEFAGAPGVRLLSQLPGADARHLRIGMEVRPLFPSDSGEPLLTFTTG